MNIDMILVMESSSAGRDHRHCNDHEKDFIREWANEKGLRVDRDSWRINLVY